MTLADTDDVELIRPLFSTRLFFLGIRERAELAVHAETIDKSQAPVISPASLAFKP